MLTVCAYRAQDFQSTGTASSTMERTSSGAITGLHPNFAIGRHYRLENARLVHSLDAKQATLELNMPRTLESLLSPFFSAYTVSSSLETFATIKTLRDHTIKPFPSFLHSRIE